jgi:hypothetical protein
LTEQQNGWILNQEIRDMAKTTKTTEKHFRVGDSGKREVTLVARGTECMALATRIWGEDDSEDGIISAGAMVDYFPGQPTLHTETHLYSALLAAGCEVIRDEEEV